MRPTSALLFPPLLLLLLLLPPPQCHGRTVSRCELRDKLRDKIKLSERTQNLTDVVLTLLVCQLEKVSHRSTSFVTIYGQRATTTAAPATTTTTAAIPTTNSTAAADQIVIMSNQTVNSNATVPTPLSNSTAAPPVNQSGIGNQSVNSNQTLNEVNDGQDQDQEDDATGEEPEQEEEPEAEEEQEELLDGAEETYDEEGEYLYVNQGSKMDFHLDDWLKLMELLNEEENMFDEQMLVIADDKLSADEDDGSGKLFQMEWSLGYHGLFQLSDSYFCQSTARWSQNACNSTCDAFIDDDITNDVDCFVKTQSWMNLFRTASSECFQVSNYFDGCN
ncbi:uncharacterized protein LOC109527664 [Hippocampus comes]|uniref:uncharacterized protein LOC109527664 n=1 Tax=Hippocampus comes TaxID=109280 RepID=UPI00094EE8B0|nr:PREDICTED: alpha-lactalbumin [Hippocampus comes]XP_019745257.1 PREDICTED: alpha-lactalbumin [Hippocampus comes]